MVWNRLSMKQTRYIQPPLPLSQHQPRRGKRKKKTGCPGRWSAAIGLPYYKERRFVMEILTHIIFVLNLLKTFINHFF